MTRRAISKPMTVFTALFLIACAIGTYVVQSRWDDLWIYGAFTLLVGLPVYLKWRSQQKRHLETAQDELAPND